MFKTYSDIDQRSPCPGEVLNTFKAWIDNMVVRFIDTCCPFDVQEESKEAILEDFRTFLWHQFR